MTTADRDRGRRGPTRRSGDAASGRKKRRGTTRRSGDAASGRKKRRGTTRRSGDADRDRRASWSSSDPGNQKSEVTGFRIANCGFRIAVAL